MKITPEQQRIIDSLKCERVSDDLENLRIVEHFCSHRNDNIAHSLRNEAYEEDEKGVIAYYVVKHPNGNILFFFSLKCGMLYDQFINDRNMLLFKEMGQYLENLSLQGDLTSEEKKIVEAIKEKLRSHKGVTKSDLDRMPKKEHGIIVDLEKEFNENITHVGSTYSGIELVHFCANDNARKDWEELQIEQRLGFVVFWQFIVQKVLECRKIIGCQYLFLFAADRTEDETLVSYYNDLNFNSSADRATVKPLYDLTCKFMFQEICHLAERRDFFFENFNRDEDAV